MKSTIRTFINKIASPYPGFTEAIRAAKTIKVKRPAPSGLYSGVNKRSQDAERLVMQGHNSLKDAKRFKDIYDVQSGARKDIARQSLINSMTKASDSYRKAYKTNPVVARKILGRKPSSIYKPLDRGAILTAMEKVQNARSELMEKVAKGCKDSKKEANTIESFMDKVAYDKITDDQLDKYMIDIGKAYRVPTSIASWGLLGSIGGGVGGWKAGKKIKNKIPAALLGSAIGSELGYQLLGRFGRNIGGKAAENFSRAELAKLTLEERKEELDFINKHLDDETSWMPKYEMTEDGRRKIVNAPPLIPGGMALIHRDNL